VTGHKNKTKKYMKISPIPYTAMNDERYKIIATQINSNKFTDRV